MKSIKIKQHNTASRWADWLGVCASAKRYCYGIDPTFSLRVDFVPHTCFLRTSLLAHPVYILIKISTALKYGVKLPRTFVPRSMYNIHLLQMMENTERMMRKQEGINESAVIQRFLMRGYFGIVFFSTSSSSSFTYRAKQYWYYNHFQCAITK